jgi:glycosyltransferase involved in cell wall biosynthesis
MQIDHFEVLVVGGVGADLNEMRQLAKAEGIERLVTIEGRVSQEELVPQMLRSGIGVLPNIRTPIGEKYTSPLKLFEYLACDDAILASDLPAMREVLVECENALFFEPSNSKQLAQQLDRLLADTELRKHLQEQNAVKARYYSWDHRAERVLSLLA